MPLPPRSVESQMIGIGEVKPENLSIGIAAISLPFTSFTDTTQWLTHTYVDLYVPTKRMLLDVDITVAFYHGVANAKMGYGLWVYDMDTGSPLNLGIAWQVGGYSSAWGIPLHATPSTPLWYGWPARISFDTDHLNRNPGPKRIYFVVRNWTVGTLTSGDPSLNTNAALITLKGK